jgi:hypothetical protein
LLRSPARSAPPTEVARRLGHSVAVLLRVDANFVDGDARRQPKRRV